jgi:hypothetical protein
MIFNIYSFCFIILFFGTLKALPPYRYRRQINSRQNSGPYGQPVADTSGSIVGTYYYGECNFHELIIFACISLFYNYIGIGSDPNYGSYIQQPNSANGGSILPISYNPDSNLYGELIRPNYPQQQQQQQQGYLYNYNYNNNNAWQGQNLNNYNNPFYNRYPPGSQGWYATGGNYWYNNGKSIIPHPYLVMISTVILVLCK